MASVQNIFTGTTPPSTTPTHLGQHYINTVAGKSYTSVGTSSAADWRPDLNPAYIQPNGNPPGGYSFTAGNATVDGVAGGSFVFTAGNPHGGGGNTGAFTFNLGTNVDGTDVPMQILGVGGLVVDVGDIIAPTGSIRAGGDMSCNSLQASGDITAGSLAIGTLKADIIQGDTGDSVTIQDGPIYMDDYENNQAGYFFLNDNSVGMYKTADGSFVIQADETASFNFPGGATQFTTTQFHIIATDSAGGGSTWSTANADDQTTASPISFNTGVGGTSDDSAAGGNGGQINFTSGQGGDGTDDFISGNGGNIVFTTGIAGTPSGGGDTGLDGIVKFNTSELFIQTPTGDQGYITIDESGVFSLNNSGNITLVTNDPSKDGEFEVKALQSFFANPSGAGITLNTGDETSINLQVPAGPSAKFSLDDSGVISLILGDDCTFNVSNTNATGTLSIEGVQVLAAQQPAIADSSVLLSDVVTKFNTLLAELRIHGLIAT